jgi:hypothetical protein
MGWVVNATPQSFTPGKDPVPTVQEAGWVSEPFWTGTQNFALTRIRSPDRPSRGESLPQLSYPGPFANWIWRAGLSGLLRGVDIRALLGLYVAHNGGLLPTFRDIPVEFIFKCEAVCLNFEVGTKKLPRNIRKKLPFYGSWNPKRA